MASGSESERSESPVDDESPRKNHLGKNLTLKFLVNSKEAGGIIGKGGENIKKYRADSGARINISEGTAAERVVVVIGTASQIKSAFNLIAEKFQEDSKTNGSRDSSNVTFKLVLPNPNCGSLIGKSGANIKELREATGASIQVANELLPNSTERSVTLTGSIDSVMQALDKICTITAETKPKGPVIPYQPGHMGYPGGYGYGLNDGVRSGAYGQVSYGAAGRGSGSSRNQYPMLADGRSGRDPYSYGEPMLRPGLLGNPGAMVPGAGGRVITKEIPISNDSVGSIIGRQGSRINDIRQSTGANIRVAEAEEGSGERKVIITGNAPNVRAASYIVRNICAPPRNKAAAASAQD